MAPWDFWPDPWTVALDLKESNQDYTAESSFYYLKFLESLIMFWILLFWDWGSLKSLYPKSLKFTLSKAPSAAYLAFSLSASLNLAAPPSINSFCDKSLQLL